MAKRTGESLRDLQTKAEVLQALGGIHAVAALTGSDWKNVEMWKRAKYFPAHFFLVMTCALHTKHLTAPPQLWRQVTPASREAALTALIAAQKQKVAA